MFARGKPSEPKTKVSSLPILGRRSTPRVEVILRGGLGNQLFGYSAGTELATRLGTSLHLIIDSNMGAEGAKRQFCLDGFLSSGVTWSDTGTKMKRFEEKSFGFDQRFSELSEPHLLVGYFQSWKYFVESAAMIKAQLSLSPQFANGRRIAGHEFLGLHLRRGDYLLPKNAKFHGVVPFEFFKTGLHHLRKVSGNLPGIIFSDDIHEAKELSRQLNDCEIFDEDLTLGPLGVLGALSSANGHVISNSTFGWWGAFLSSNDGTVIAPRPWLKGGHFNTTDLLPPRWLSLGF